MHFCNLGEKRFFGGKTSAFLHRGRFRKSLACKSLRKWRRVELPRFCEVGRLPYGETPGGRLRKIQRIGRGDAEQRRDAARRLLRAIFFSAKLCVSAYFAFHLASVVKERGVPRVAEPRFYRIGGGISSVIFGRVGGEVARTSSGKAKVHSREHSEWGSAQSGRKLVFSCGSLVRFFGPASSGLKKWREIRTLSALRDSQT